MFERKKVLNPKVIFLYAIKNLTEFSNVKMSEGGWPFLDITAETIRLALVVWKVNDRDLLLIDFMNTHKVCIRCKSASKSSRVKALLFFIVLYSVALILEEVLPLELEGLRVNFGVKTGVFCSFIKHSKHSRGI